ncbi:chemotaxis protein [Oceanobacillus piezotolerans]|uniref:Chemotaxis protein n=1 Tax=Oceanobacillus piezotolerans TaxID=2448030 RepID=A0A498DC64_9BACI|nr:methyl-accepting chemotaxis protein [Oceanobacillus piezotolerans]RLL47088.1 chemotaxis protein [Oceanobacillus piezotolerans]
MSVEIEAKHHPTIEAFINLAPYIQELINDDITIGIYDKEKLIINFPAKTFALNVTPGDPLLEGDIITKAIRENRNQAMTVPAEILGVNLVSRAVPIRDELGRVVGGVGVGQNVDKANKLNDISSSLSHIVEDVTKTVLDMANSISDLAGNMNFISNKSNEVNHSIKQIEEVSGVVKGIAEQSNLLGLNAAIESARAGEHGRGFSVVADEIRKMASGSKKQVEEIQDITTNIKEIIDSLNQDIQKANLESDSQSAAIEELTATMEEVNSNIHTLADLARENIELKN